MRRSGLPRWVGTSDAIVPDMDFRFDHLYRETHHWADSGAWWGNLGFAFAQQWGEHPHRAGTLVKGATTVVLAEIPAADEPSASTFYATDHINEVARQLGSEVVDTHWGTRMVTATDPDGRTYNFEPEATA